MLSISLKLSETFSVFFFLKQGCAQAEPGGPAGHSGFYWFRTMGHLQFSSEHSLVKCIPLSSDCSSVLDFCDIINNYYSDITNMKFENFSIYLL